MDIQSVLKNQNLSVTALRIALLDALGKAPHSDANKVYHMISQRISTTSIQAVYNNLHVLVDHGIIREIKPKGAPSLYETKTGDNHHHIVCRSCRAVHDTHCTHGSAPCLETTNTHGFQIDEAEIVFWGICPDCQSNS